MLIFDSMKVLGIKSSMLFNFDFANNKILTCFFILITHLYLYFLIPAVITQIFKSIAELGAPTKEVKAKINAFTNCRN